MRRDIIFKSIAGLCVTGMIFTGCSGMPQKKAQKSTETTDNVVVQEQDNAQSESDVQEETTEKIADQKQLYVVTRIDEKNKTIQFENIDNGKLLQYSYTGGTYFYDKFGQSVSINVLCCGKIVTFEESDTGNLKCVNVSDDVWTFEEVKDLQINEEEQIVTIDGTKYYYGSRYWLFSGDNDIDFKDITDMDVMSVQGVDRKIISVVVTSGHGKLKLKNTELFEGGWLKIGNIVEQITANMEVEVPEGEYEMSVANDGYGDAKDITVERGQIQEIDLNEFKGAGPKICTLTFTTDVAGAVLKINGETVDYSQPFTLKYGTYTVTLSADGYDTISRYLIVNSETANIGVTMTSNGSADSDEGTESTSENEADTVGRDNVISTSAAGSMAGSLAGRNHVNRNSAAAADTAKSSQNSSDVTSDTSKDIKSTASAIYDLLTGAGY